MKAGWAETDITPPTGLPMGGRGPRFGVGTEILDPLFAQALVLEDDGGERTLWVSVELLGLERDRGFELRYQLAAHTGIPVDQVIVNYAHIHSGPMVGIEGYSTDLEEPEVLTRYMTEMQKRIVRAAVEAVESMRPASASLHRGSSYIGINRRNRDEHGVMDMRPSKDGAHNPDLWVLDIRAEDGGRCVVFNYGCHPVIVYGFAFYSISAGWPGEARRTLRESLGKGVHSQFMQGTAGNIRPRILADLENNKFRTSTPDDVKTAGRQIAADVIDALSKDGEALQLSLAGAATWFTPLRDLSKVPDIDHWRRCAREEDELTRNLGLYWVRRLEAGQGPDRAVPWAVGLLRLTEKHVVAWLAGEAVTEWLPLIRSWVAADVALWGYCQYSGGYLPVDALIPEGGYEVEKSNQYHKNGPGPFLQGVDASARAAIQGLARHLGIELPQ